MNIKEIDEALKIIKEPIVVNSIEYKYFTQENYNKLIRVYENCRWFVNNYEQVNKYLEQELQRKDNEIKQLREDIVNHIKIASEYKEQMIIKDNIINECAEDILKELKENNHLSYGVALSIRQKLISYKELKEVNK